MAEQPRQGPGEHWEKKRGIENPVASLAEQGIDNTSLIVLASYRLSSRPLHQLRQLGDVDRDPSRLIAGQELCGCSAPPVAFREQ